MNFNRVTFEQMTLTAALMESDSAALRTANWEHYRDAGLRATVHKLRAYMAQCRQWETSDTIPMKLSWRQRIHALFGGEIPTVLNVSVYRNCPHLQVTDQRQHIAFLAPELMKNWGKE